MIEDPRAWIKKYLRADSEQYWLFLDEIKGIKDNKLSSNPTHAPNQEEEETDNRVPISKVKKNKKCGEDSIIKKRGDVILIDGVWTHKLCLAYLFKISIL